MFPGTCSINILKPRNAVWKQITANFLIGISLTTATHFPRLGIAVVLQGHAAPTTESQWHKSMVSACPSKLSIFKGHLSHQRTAVVISAGVRPFIAVDQDFKWYRFLKNYMKTQSAAQSSFQCFPQMYTNLRKKKLKKKYHFVKPIWWVLVLFYTTMLISAAQNG